MHPFQIIELKLRMEVAFLQTLSQSTRVVGVVLFADFFMECCFRLDLLSFS